MIEARPEAVQRLVDAMREALLATRDDPGHGLAKLCHRFPETDAERAIAGWHASSPLIFGDSELGSMDRETWERTVEHYAGLGSFDLDSLFDDTFVKARAEAAAGAGARQ